MGACVVCEKTAHQGALCLVCAAKLELSVPLCPEQLESYADVAVDAALVDPWGRLHALGVRTVLGRDPGSGTAILIRQGSVSRRHACIDYDVAARRATLRDLGSTNGSAVGRRMVIGATELVAGDVLRVGSVALYYVSPLALSPQRDSVSAPTVRKLDEPLELDSPFGPESVTEVGLARLAIHIVEATGGGGGVVSIEDTQVRLPLLQLELVALLLQRMLADENRPGALRGYVHSSEILGHVNWDTAHPGDDHVKQLVRRTRRTLERAGAGDLIESSQGLGYRLRVLPT